MKYTEENIAKQKACVHCGKMMDYDEWVKSFSKTRNVKLAPLWWGNKKFCSKACCNRFRQKDTKPCEHCGKIFNRHWKDANPMWKKRKFCSRKCALEYGWIIRLADCMGLKYEVLKNELIKIAEKYS